MSAFLRKLILGAALLAGVQHAAAFSLLGTSEPYTTEASLGHEGSASFQLTPGFANWVKNLDDEYRWNTRVVYYTFDSEFLSYFGSNGIVAIDQAMSAFNALTNVSSYSTNLIEFPLRSRRQNYTASALGLLDLKTVGMSMVIEQLGLGLPEYHTWTLLNRALPPGASCPVYDYNVVMRNFDPISLSPTAYVNGNLLTYQIIELCPNPSQASAEEYLVDPLGSIYTAVASYGFSLGDFTTSFSRDDLGGLRYLLRTNNVNWETSPADSVIYVTNQSPALVYPTNLQVFAQQSFTNDAATLQGLYPGLVVIGSSNYWVNEITTNAFAYFTNYPWQPVGAPPILVTGTNYTTNVATRFVHSYQNVVTNYFFPYCLQSLLITNIAPAPLTPPGSGISQTNVSVQTTVDTNCVSGSIFIVPTNICDYSILYTQLTYVVYATNFLTNTYTTNLVTYTNATSTNAFDYYEYSASVLDIFTNEVLVALAVDCPAQIETLFQGIERVTFIRRDYDSLLGQFFEPVTNDFSMIEITNNTRRTLYGRRATIVPDVLFSAAVLAPPPTAWPIGLVIGAVSQPDYVTAASNINVLGPGVIQPAVVLTFNKVGNVLYNQGPQFIEEFDALPYFRWGSFDGTTNAPVAYPVGTDLMSLEYLAVLQVTQPSATTNGVLQLPDGSVGVAYQGAGYQLAVVGGEAPYTWSVEVGPPAALTLSPSGLISGTPVAAGVFDFSLRLTDANARTVVYPFTLTVSP